jgi:hypothetical protein
VVDHGCSDPIAQHHLARLVGYKTTYLYGASNSPERYYRTYNIPKVSGGLRIITEPLPSLKEIQRWILDNILDKVPVHPFAKGFVRNRSIRDNARFHQRQRFVLTLDIENFFNYVAATTVRKVFLDLGYSSNVAVLLGNCARSAVVFLRVRQQVLLYPILRLCRSTNACLVTRANLGFDTRAMRTT